MNHLGTADAEDDSGSQTRLAPSPHSEAVAHEFKELSLQPSQYLPPLNERKNVLQLRLQQRRTREQLVDQGIMPPLKSPAAFHEQIKSLERARTENFLKHKIRSRPDRSELVRMHILEETFAEPSLQATQMKLKRARLADDLNEKIAQRPGPMELVEKNILPVDSSVKEAIIAVGQENYPQALDDYSFDEDSSDALSPDQPASQESQGSAASPGEPKPSDSPSPVTPNAATSTQYPPLTSPVPEFLKTPPTIEQHVTRSTATTTLTTNTVSAAKPGPTLVKQSHPKNPNEKHRSKKCKEPKPRVKKLKYHQYIPPDQKGEKNEPQMDSNYARLLQQQQLFLQLQILSQQQQHYNYQTILPAPLKPLNDKQSNNGNTPLTNLNSSTPTSAASSPRQNTNIPSRKPGPLPSSLDDLKVAELKMELKLRGLPVSGTKTDLIERLKTYQDLNNNGVATSSSVTAATSTGATGNTGEVSVSFPVATLNKPAANTVSSFPPEKTSTGPGCKAVNAENISSPLPVSPSPSEQSSLSTDDTSMADTFTEMMTMMSPSQFLSTSPLRANTTDDNQNRSSGNISTMEFDVAEKDRKLQEKEKQIEELKRKLEQEQKLVEVLKMQLEVEKRGQQQQSQTSGNSAALEQKQLSTAVKDENALTDCSSTSQSVPVASHSLGQSVYTSSQNPVAKKAVVIKQEIPVAKAEPQNAISQFYVNPQRQPQTAVVAQPQALLTTQGTAQLLLPLSIQGPNSTTAVQLPVGNIKLQVFPPTTSNTVFSYQTAPVTTPSQSFINETSNSNIHTGGNQVPSVQNGPATPNKPGSPSQAQPYIVQQTLFNNTVSKTKDPPRYEEAIKQTRNIQTSHREISSAHSQQMDDLFDILIKSGEITLPIKEEPSPISKMRPVTANITTMPVNTVISRPPPQIQMAPPPVSLEPTTSLSISLENQLEALLDGTLPSGNEIPQLTSSNEDRESFSLIEDLQNDLLNHSSILDHSHSPMETSDPQFTSNNSCLSLDLPDANLDNMEWLDITMPSSSSGLTPLSSTAPSVFSTDFLDPQDLQLHWD
ncbi:myocardin-related transcription factor B isoform X5 [Pezoporus wallicus]|uniref:myocardin-related transcription factor B isoform X5 n=1 Tax=Pezoporus wallicus TaxID=35540 RepID=UPI00254BE84A|nr:myocardin-related transcription factor B isoform X5 [Pezoporus wallicus]XP_061329214.1 myocardin-related transcription factor B isoform X5 [Pezoporus flaviventris]